MPKKNVKFIPTRPVEAHPHSRHPEAHPHSLCHPEGRSPVRVSGQVDTVFGSQGPHALQAQDDEERKKDSGRRASGEQGRSMVEMLGTLAIMGVLSIGGVAGYRYAVDKANANAILDGVNKRAVIVSQQRIMGQEVNLSEFEADIKGAYPTTAEIYADSRFFAVLVDKVPQGVCDHILREKTRFASDVFVSTGAGTGVDDCPEGESMIEFTFANDFNAGEQLERCTTKSDCASACENCQNGVCVESCPTGQACARSVTGNVLTTETCCPTERIMNDTCCASVSYDAAGKKLCCATSNQTQCCPAGQFFINNTCYDCNDPRAISHINTTYYNTACDICPNRVVGGWMCQLECAEPDQILWNGRCLCPNEKPIMTADGKCKPCGSSGIWGNATFKGVIDVPKSGDVCLAVAYCGNMWCNGGYVWACPEGKISGADAILLDGTAAAGGAWRCRSCDEIQIGKLKYKSQCELCGGTWTGEWWKGTCTPPTE